MIGQCGTYVPTVYVWKNGGTSLLQVYTPNTSSVWQAFANADQANIQPRKCYIAVSGEQVESSAGLILPRPNNITIRYWKRLQ